MTDNFLSILCFKKGHRAACVNESFRFVAIVLSIAKDLLREIRVRGFMLESRATVLYRTRGFSQSGILNALEYNTSLICELSGNQYQINPAMQDALYKILDESSPPSQG